MQLIKRNQAGETIIEVLIALSVFGMALGISYASAARSMRASRDALERTQASQLTQSTIEVIRTYASYNDPAINATLFPLSDARICIPTDMRLISVKAPPVAMPMHHGVCSYGTNGIYFTDVIVNPLGGGTDAYEYTVRTTWDSLRSENEGQVVMRYKWVRVTP